MRRKAFIDWENINRIIKTKKASTMPGNNQFWDEGYILEGLDTLISQEISNTKEKMASVSDIQFEESTEDIRNDIVIETSEGATYVIAIITDKKAPSNNETRYIPCTDGICFNGYVKDTSKDAYLVECLDFIPLGSIPVIFRIKLANIGQWNIPIPMSGRIVEKLLAPYHKRILKDVRKKYSKQDYEIHYLQMISASE